jgi:hypothetical protein
MCVAVATPNANTILQELLIFAKHADTKEFVTIDTAAVQARMTMCRARTGAKEGDTAGTQGGTLCDLAAHSVCTWRWIGSDVFITPTILGGCTDSVRR